MPCDAPALAKLVTRQLYAAFLEKHNIRRVFKEPRLHKGQWVITGPGHTFYGDTLGEVRANVMLHFEPELKNTKET